MANALMLSVDVKRATRSRVRAAAARLGAIAQALRDEGWDATFTADARAGTVSVVLNTDAPPVPGPLRLALAEEGEAD